MRRLKRPIKILVTITLTLVTLLIVLIAAAFFTLRRSLPDYGRDATVASLTAPVTVERDALAIPTIHAATWEDAARALGYVHAQDRLFQMDLARRYPVGRLAELVGGALVDLDKKQRRFRFERVAEEVYARLPERQRDLLGAYSDGVNAAIAAMPARPPEYLILRTKPEPWRPEDCILVNFNMHLGLSLFGNNELQMAMLREKLPAELVEFLTPRTTTLDAPLIESEPAPAPPPIPGPDVIDLRKPVGGRGSVHAPGGAALARGEGVFPGAVEPPVPPEWLGATDRLVPGSNCFAVSAKRTADGRAILENDMHLGFSAPNIWYRADIRWARTPDDTGRSGGDQGGHAVGVTLPGVPSIIVGSNTHVAWGFTNATGDFADYIVVETLPDDPDRYRTPEGSEPFTTITETINVRAGAPETLTLRKTRWGPVFDTDEKGRPLVLQWTATDPDRNNLAILDMPLARTLHDAVATARAWHGPPQNTLIASADGRIAWVLAGDLPLRRGFDGTVPMPRTDPNVGWFGSRPENERPIIIDPPSGLLYTANNRTLPLERADLIGHNWAPPFRVHRIRELLEARPTHTERSMLDIALDTRLGAYDFYRDLVLDAVSADEPEPTLAAARAAVTSWDGHANTASVGLPLLIRFRGTLRDDVIQGLLAACGMPGVSTGWLNDDEPLRRLLDARPKNLLPSEQQSWDSMIRADLRFSAERFMNDKGVRALDTPWGATNRAHIKNALTLAVRTLVPILDMPPDPLAGHPWCVRVMAPTFGASERLAVSPGHEDEAICEMPTGQCGHPLSRHYRDMQRAFLRGEPTPLLPGPPEHTLTLSPGASNGR